MSEDKQPADYSGSSAGSSICPECGSKRIGGLMEAFWVPLLDDGSPDGDWKDWSGETEVGCNRICYDCEHKFEI